MNESIPRTPEAYRDFWRDNAPVPYGFCWCGCGQQTSIAKQSVTRDGHVSGEPLRFRRGHHGARVSCHFRVDEATGCWIWQRATDKGYGKIGTKTGSRSAHRVYYERHRESVPQGLHLHHRCVEEGFGTTLCVNPDHMEVVTPGENLRRGARTKLTLESADEIRRLRSEGQTHRALSEQFGVSKGTIWAILTNRTWR